MRHLLAIVTLTLAASPAFAEVCDKERPGWDGTETSLLSEAIVLFMSPIPLFLLGALAVAVVLRHAMGAATVALLWSTFITFLIWPDATGIRQAALAEGCVAPPTLFIIGSAVLCFAAVVFTNKREKRL